MKIGVKKNDSLEDGGSSMLDRSQFEELLLSFWTTVDLESTGLSTNGIDMVSAAEIAGGLISANYPAVPEPASGENSIDLLYKEIREVAISSGIDFSEALTQVVQKNFRTFLKAVLSNSRKSNKAKKEREFAEKLETIRKNPVEFPPLEQNLEKTQRFLEKLYHDASRKREHGFHSCVGISVDELAIIIMRTKKSIFNIDDTQSDDPVRRFAKILELVAEYRGDLFGNILGELVCDKWGALLQVLKREKDIGGVIRKPILKEMLKLQRRKLNFILNAKQGDGLEVRNPSQIPARYTDPSWLERNT